METQAELVENGPPKKVQRSGFSPSGMGFAYWSIQTVVHATWLARTFGDQQLIAERSSSSGRQFKFHEPMDLELMSTASPKSTVFKRDILGINQTVETATHLQANLVNLIDLALLLKQAHWNVTGSNFRSVHLQLDEIIESVRGASDDVAERINTLGVAPDGRSATVAQQSVLENYPSDFQKVATTLGLVADALMTTIEGLREAIDKLGELDPISEDLLISISAALEKHLWMVQAQEL